MTQDAENSRRCSQCGGRLTDATGKCPTCDGAGPGRSPSLATAAAVFLAFAVFGGASLYHAVNAPGAGPRAVSGSPTNGAATEAQGSLPAGHPSLELPQEVIDFLDDLTKQAEATPDDAAAWQRLARARYRAGLLDRRYFASASQAVEHVLQLEPDNAEAIRISGNIAYDMGDFIVAERQFRRFLELDPSDPGVKTDLASAVLFEGRGEEATALYREIIRDNPDFVQAHVNLGIALHAHGSRDEALASLRRARELATDPEQQQRIDEVIARAEGREPTRSGSVAEAPATGTPLASPPAATANTNAGTDFQRGVDELLLGHRIVGQRIVAIDWSAPTQAAVRLAGFPMDQMPPVMRNKFKSGMNESIAKLASAHGVDGEIRVDLTDDANGKVMDTLDSKEWVGAFDEKAYE